MDLVIFSVVFVVIFALNLYELFYLLFKVSIIHSVLLCKIYSPFHSVSCLNAFPEISWELVKMSNKKINSSDLSKCKFQLKECGNKINKHL